MVASENNLPSVLGAVVQIIAALAASGVLTLSLRLIWQVRKGREARLRTEPVRKPSLLEAEQGELIALRRAWTEELEARYRRVLKEQDAWYTRLSAEQDRRWWPLETQSQELSARAEALALENARLRRENARLEVENAVAR